MLIGKIKRGDGKNKLICKLYYIYSYFGEVNVLMK